MTLNRILKTAIVLLVVHAAWFSNANSGSRSHLATGTIQATATVVDPRGSTAPDDNLLTSMPQEFDISGTDSRTDPLGELLIRFPSSDGLLISVEADGNEINRFNLGNLPGVLSRTQTSNKNEFQAVTIEACQLFDGLAANSTECVVTLIYTEN